MQLPMPKRQHGTKRTSKFRRPGVFTLAIIPVIAWMSLSLCLAEVVDAAAKKASGKLRLLVVSSYHRGYEWERETNEGFCAALRKFRYFDDGDQVADFTKTDAVETS